MAFNFELSHGYVSHDKVHCTPLTPVVIGVTLNAD